MKQKSSIFRTSIAILIGSTLLLNCSTAKKTKTVSVDGLVKEWIVFKKKELGYKAVYSISIPELKGYVGMQSMSTHCHGFEFDYWDSSRIYYETGGHFCVSPNSTNYKSVLMNGLTRSDLRDTVISGQQADGNYWKEILSSRGLVGYLNVKMKDKALFDKAVLTFEDVSKL